MRGRRRCPRRQETGSGASDVAFLLKSGQIGGGLEKSRRYDAGRDAAGIGRAADVAVVVIENEFPLNLIGEGIVNAEESVGDVGDAANGVVEDERQFLQTRMLRVVLRAQLVRDGRVNEFRRICT